MQEQAQAEEQPGYELEQWIVDFASLFRDHTGIDPDKHLDLQVTPSVQCCLCISALGHARLDTAEGL